MASTSMAKADFFSALVFLVLGVYMIVEGLGMPGAGGFIEPGGEPGRVPVLLGAIVAFFAIVLLVRSVSQRGHKVFEKPNDENPEPLNHMRAIITAAGCSFYAVGLVGADIAGWDVMYHEATGLFLFLFITISEWQSAPDIGHHRWSWVQTKWPSLANLLQAVFSFISSDRAPYIWVIIMALLQAVLVTWGVTYLFEQEFYVQLP